MNEDLLLRILAQQLSNGSRAPLEAPSVGPSYTNVLGAGTNLALKDSLEQPFSIPQPARANAGTAQHLLATRWQPEPDAPPQSAGAGVPGLNFGSTKASGGMIGGFDGSPWDALFGAIGPIHGALEGNDPSTPFVPAGRNRYGSDNALIGAGGLIGTGVGSIFGMPGAGRMAGQNVGATFSDLFHGDFSNLGRDVSANLPPLPGMQAEGWKGLLNGATGLPFGSLLGLIFH